MGRKNAAAQDMSEMPAALGLAGKRGGSMTDAYSITITDIESGLRKYQHMRGELKDFTCPVCNKRIPFKERAKTLLRHEVRRAERTAEVVEKWARLHKRVLKRDIDLLAFFQELRELGSSRGGPDLSNYDRLTYFPLMCPSCSLGLTIHLAFHSKAPDLPRITDTDLARLPVHDEFVRQSVRRDLGLSSWEQLSSWLDGTDQRILMERLRRLAEELENFPPVWRVADLDTLDYEIRSHAHPLKVLADRLEERLKMRPKMYLDVVEGWSHRGVPSWVEERL